MATMPAFIRKLCPILTVASEVREPAPTRGWRIFGDVDLARLDTEDVVAWDRYRHTFSHYHLDIEPLLVKLPASRATVMEGDGQLWYNCQRPQSVGLAAPVAKLLKKLENLG